MAYNNIFPMNYGGNFYPNYPQMQAQPQMQTPIQAQPQSGAMQGQGATAPPPIIWVQGEAGAKSYLLAPNTTVQLWDSEEQVIYLKSADASGMPSMKVLDYTIRDNQSPQNSGNGSKTGETIDYALKSDLGAIWAEINALQKKVERRGKKDEQPIVRNDEE